MDLDSMKYAELQKLAKELGLKANMKADKLLKAVKQHYQQEKNKEEDVQGQNNNDASVQEDENAACEEAASNAIVFVNTRRGKGNCTKRKLPDAAAVTESGAEKPIHDAKGNTEVDVPCNARGAKKRRLSSAKDSDKTEAEQQPGIKDEAPVQAEAEKAPKVAKAGKIPRLQQKNKPSLKPVTPNFKKLHEAQFNKMESIDSYFQRRTKQMENHKNQDKDLKKNPVRATMFSPALVNKKTAEERRRHTLLSATKAAPNKPARKESVPFRPSVLSTRRINVRFSEATQDNEHKRSLVKTPARMSPCLASSTPQRQTADAGKPRTSAFSATKIPGPFVFSGNTSTSTTPGTQKKPAFDLKASLSRPLSYRPHTGKLKPFGEVKENTAGDRSVNSNTRQDNYKQHKVQSRNDRRNKQKEDAGSRRKKACLVQRRGLVMM
ncbi:LOW QUALITY PROTEIN: nucleolar and spindle-associated protein 1 [Acanthochromis polyacanthus]|uniref:LOW QUALITY PROTEIN: nucleolar and spindle-associated protein 1 n=1 Tax=Acanthochromis polyacanthus TaxID=80966 RepID=UPI002234A326|nr:LOW QUALITY PROTEIN: nucleolar and spindle-associated protein 1 [Acanthochromis polyacanthus]